MSNRYKGGVISATAPTTSSSVATGVWTLEQQLQAKTAGNWPFTPSAPSAVEYLVIAGGGGGGSNLGGGGGAGGFRTATGFAVATGSPITVTVGGGGAGGAGGGQNRGTNGSNSVFSTITSTGGGAGAGSMNLVRVRFVTAEGARVEAQGADGDAPEAASGPALAGARGADDAAGKVEAEAQQEGDLEGGDDSIGHVQGAVLKDVLIVLQRARWHCGMVCRCAAGSAVPSMHGEAWREYGAAHSPA